MSFSLTRRMPLAAGAGVAGKPKGAAPYLSPAGALAALAAAVLLCWPMLVTRAPLVYFDTVSYFTNGAQLWYAAVGLVLSIIDPGALAEMAGDAGSAATAGDAAAAAAGAGTGGAGGVTFRSLAYAAFFYPAALSPLGLALVCMLQTAMTLFVFLGLVPRLPNEARVPAAAGFAAVGLLSSLPWFASYAMPDILGAVLPVYFALALGRADSLGLVQRIVLMGIAAFAILSHYGHLPMVLVLAPAALLWRGLRGRLSRGAWAFCLLPVAAAFGFNLAASIAVSIVTQGGALALAAPLEAPGTALAHLPESHAPAGLLLAAAVPAELPRREPASSEAPRRQPPSPEPPRGEPPSPEPTAGVSFAPNRIPVLLARSIEDGPARWYLQEECRAVDRYAICELFDQMPDNVWEVLWAPDGIRTATPEQMARIRAEETEIVLAAARRYPVQQGEALVRNTLYQAVLLGTGELLPMPAGAPDATLYELAPVTSDNENDPALQLFDWIIPVFTVLAFLVLAWRLATGRVQSFLVEAVVMVLFALLVNAAVYGGLSAPVDRYQARLAWLIPALLALDLALRSRTGSARTLEPEAA